jgi:DNA-binding transcriptional ArsR family regulator
MGDVFTAIADPSRRQILNSLNRHGGQNLVELSVGLDMTRQSVSKHVAVLEAESLVFSVRRGRERLHYLNAEAVFEVAGPWINQFDRIPDRVRTSSGAPFDMQQARSSDASNAGE